MSSVRSAVLEYKAHGKDAAIENAFAALDIKGNGQLDRSEVAAFMQEAATLIRLEVQESVISDAVDALMEDVGASTAITKPQFQDIFKRHPDLLKCFEDEISLASIRSTIAHSHLSAEEMEEDEIENEQVWTHAHTHWKSEKVALVWIFLYLAANIAAFTYKGIKYANSDEATQVFGNCIVVARGSAQCLNLNCCLIMLPICRHLLTHLRATPLRFLFPFDAVLEYHIYIGIAIAIFVVMHVMAHMCDFHRFSRADEGDIYALFGDKLGDDIPEGIGDRWKLLLATPAGITGIIMVVCMLIAYPFTLRRRNSFNAFWVTHHLLIVMVIALCFHGMSSLLEPFQSVYWVMLPLALYLIPRAIRETPLSKVKVLDIEIKRGNVVGLKLARPKSWDAHIRAGMYAHVNIPSISCLEWHPFTLTSAPSEDFIEFHFRNSGDWTSDVHDLLEDIAPKQDEEGERRFKIPTDLVIKVDGPTGASSQGFSDYPIVVLIGAGIGVTPMISVLKQLLVTPGKMQRTFLYWTVRDRASLEWFSSLVDEIYESDQKHRIQLRHFLTSVKDDDRDIGAVLLHHATRAKHKQSNFDLILGQYTHHQVEVGRPDWTEELESVKVEAKELGCNDCGIFLCGPAKMAEAVSDVSFSMSKTDPDFHFYFTKETF
jgi:respiratory burst oxidase